MARYKSLNSSGIENLPKENIVKNYKSMTGKDFKAISKVIIICLNFARVNNQIINAWNCICFITKFVNFKKISQIHFRTFHENLNEAVLTIGEIFTILRKSAKLHLCLYIPENIRRHGVCLGYSTEVFESFNKILRKFMSSTNHKNDDEDGSKYFHEYFRTNVYLANG